ncbi:unnamed protein product [Phytophthora lilii]|uniref:Unnamed protein product n=1 Tax=Phytophthora lilii TaxID=2077276 RepID=A0A9W6WJT5_9STRA|nr:unnamed protein product [Phytophthora lilii]
MAITARVQSQYFKKNRGLIRLAPNQDPTLRTKRAGTPWTLEEHDRFLEALERYPSGPWKSIAAHIGTRTTRQTMTHAQKYREKISRRQKAKAVESPAIKPEFVQAETTRQDMSALELPPTARLNVDVPVKHEREVTISHNQFDAQICDLDLDVDVITLLETFEPLEMLPTFEPLNPVVSFCPPTSLNDTIYWGISSSDNPFQQCIPL